MAKTKIVVIQMKELIYTAIFGLGQNKSGAASSIDLGLDLAGGVSITYEVVDDENPSQTDMDDTIYKLTKRVEAYSTEAQAYQEGNNRITIEIPGVSDANEVLKEIGTPGKLYFIEETNSNNEANYYVAFDVDDDGNMTNYGYRLDKPIEEIEASGSVLLTGTDVESAKAGTMADEFGNSQNVVELSMTAEGTKKFADATKKAYEKGETLAIYYDGELISVPYVNTPIEDGKAIISGMESFEEADILATQIRIGGLSLELQEVRSQVVGAQLGNCSICSCVGYKESSCFFHRNVRGFLTHIASLTCGVRGQSMVQQAEYFITDFQVSNVLAYFLNDARCFQTN